MNRRQIRCSSLPMVMVPIVALVALLLLLPAPVHADTLNATDDTYVNENRPGKNFGSGANIKIKDGNAFEGYAIFDLSVLGTDADDIDKATLRLWIRRVISAGTIKVCRVFAPGGVWSESTLTFNTASGFTLNDCITAIAIAASDQGTWKLVDITAIVKLWLGGTDNHGIAIIATGTNLHLDSKENKVVVQFNPRVYNIKNILFLITVSIWRKPCI